MSEYTNAQYVTLPGAGTVVGVAVEINGAPSYVPADPKNSDYQAILALVAQNALSISAAK
jgi:hypothetical protein